MKQIKLITINEFDPRNTRAHPFEHIETLGKAEFPCMIADEILFKIVKTHGLILHPVNKVDSSSIA